MSKSPYQEILKALINLEIQLAKIEVHLSDIKVDVAEQKAKQEELEKRVNSIESLKDKMLGGAFIIMPLIAFMSAIGHDLIKRFMGW